MSAGREGVQFGSVEFRHLHVALRALAFLLALTRPKGRTPFDDERAESLEAIRTALEQPQTDELATLTAELGAMREALEAMLAAAPSMDGRVVDQARAALSKPTGSEK
jgi:hypothetical protein